MNRTALSIAAVGVLGLAASSQAAAIFSDSFATDGALIGQNGWVITGTSVVNPLTVTGGVVPMANTGQDANAPLTSAFAHNDGDKLITSADINLSSVGAGDYFLHLGITGNTTLFYQRLFATSSGSGYVLGVLGTSTGTATNGTGVLAFGSTIHVDVTWNVVAGALNDTFDIAVNGLPYATNIPWGGTGAEPASLSSVNLRQGGGAAAPVLTSLDNLTVSYVVPEPAAFGVLAPAGLLLARRRRA